MKNYIIMVKEGRGKSGTAKTGNLRMLLLTQDDHESMHDFLLHARQWDVNRGRNPLPMREYFMESCKNILCRHFDGIFHLKALNGSQVCFVNTSRFPAGIDVMAACRQAMETA